MTTLVHTADWHLASPIGEVQRPGHYRAFLTWLSGYLKKNRTDILLVSGDLFDTSRPSNDATKLFFDFLENLKDEPVVIIITAGNHDSPDFFTNFSGYLESDNVHLIPSVRDREIEDLIIPCGDFAVIAIPYLRDGDLGSHKEEDSSLDREARFQQRVEHLYRTAVKKAKDLYPGRKIVLSGHLYLSGTVMSENNPLFSIGTLKSIPVSIIPPEADYTALGHIHKKQCVADNPAIRYSGSPLSISFDESDREKAVIQLTADGPLPLAIEEIPLPAFDNLVKISGDFAALSSSIEEIKRTEKEVLLSVTYTGKEAILDLKTKINALTKESGITVVSVKDEQKEMVMANRREGVEDLETLTEQQVFCRLLDQRNIPEKRRKPLLEQFNALLEEAEQD